MSYGPHTGPSSSRRYDPATLGQVTSSDARDACGGDVGLILHALGRRVALVCAPMEPGSVRYHASESGRASNGREDANIDFACERTEPRPAYFVAHRYDSPRGGGEVAGRYGESGYVTIDAPR